MKKLVIHKSFSQVVKTAIKFFIGYIFSKFYNSYQFYYSVYLHPSYEFTEPKQSKLTIEQRNKYVTDNIPFYKNEQMITNIEELSQYYHFKCIENEIKNESITICNIGCFYCGADYLFLKKHTNAVIYGLDFGDIELLNENIKHNRLKLFSGYPLDYLEKFKNERMKFDYMLFTRTATLMNISELLSYMDIISHIAKKVYFLEVAKITTYLHTKLDIEKIDINKPVRMYNGMYLHNYPKILEKYGYTVVESELLPYNFFKHSLQQDHYFINVRGRKISDIFK